MTANIFPAQDMLWGKPQPSPVSPINKISIDLSRLTPSTSLTITFATSSTTFHQWRWHVHHNRKQHQHVCPFKFCNILSIVSRCRTIPWCAALAELLQKNPEEGALNPEHSSSVLAVLYYTVTRPRHSSPRLMYTTQAPNRFVVFLSTTNFFFFTSLVLHLPQCNTAESLFCTEHCTNRGQPRDVNICESSFGRDWGGKLYKIIKSKVPAKIR